MHPVIEVMRAHSSVRRFAAVAIAPERIREAVEAAQMAATSSHIQAYSVIQVTDPATRGQLVELTGGQAYVAEAGAFLVICGDVRRHLLVADDHGVPHVQNLETFLLAVVDASLFAQNLALAFESQGLGICYIGGLRNRLPEVDRLLKVPDGVFPLFGLCAGEPEEKPATKPRLPVDAVLFTDRYPDDARLLELIGQYDETMETYYAERGLAGRNWSGGIVRRFDHPSREGLAAYYREKGAVLQ